MSSHTSIIKLFSFHVVDGNIIFKRYILLFQAGNDVHFEVKATQPVSDLVYQVNF